MDTEAFLSNIRKGLNRPDNAAFTPDPATHLSLGEAEVQKRAQAVLDDMRARSAELMGILERTAGEVGWRVARVRTVEEAALYIREAAQHIEARTMLRSAHASLDVLDLQSAMFGTGISIEVMALDEGDSDSSLQESRREDFRRKAVHADIGITGVDYAVAETGTCVLLPRKGVSRVVSLLPPVHIAVVEAGQTLPSLDELFTLRRQDFLSGDLGSYMNLISGPSRSADIEYKLVTGVHGPREAHMLLIG